MNDWTVQAKAIRGAKDDLNRVVQQLCHGDYVVHSLSGPTALKSLAELAEKYNKLEIVPNFNQEPRTRADGWKQSRYS